MSRLNELRPFGGPNEPRARGGPNKLRLFSAVAGPATILFGLWGWYSYEGVTFVAAAVTVALGVVLLAAPRGTSRALLVVRRGYQRWERWTTEADRGAFRVSRRAVTDPDETLETVAAALDAVEDLEVRRDDFAGGEGLTVVHTSYHNAFVRFTGDGRLGITGETRWVERLAGRVESVTGLSLEPTRSNPFLRARPVTGPKRIVLSLAMVVVLVLATSTVAFAAYPSSAYNPAEKTVLVSIDLRGDVDPGRTGAETDLAKADFYREVLSEKPVELNWSRNDTVRASAHAAEAVVVSRDARRSLAAARASGLSDRQRERADRIESRLRTAELAVAAEIQRLARRTDTDDSLLAHRRALLSANDTGENRESRPHRRQS